MFSDLRLSFRALAKSPGFTLVAIFALMLGIGVNAAMFGIVNVVLLRPLPLGDATRVIALHLAKPGDNRHYGTLSVAELADLRGRQKSFEDLTSQAEGTVSISGPGGDPERVSGCTMAGAGGALLRVPTGLGRWWSADEDKPEAAPVVVIGHKLWETRFAANPYVLGRPLKISGTWATIIGVAPRGFRFATESDLWKPLRAPVTDAKRDSRGLAVFGRLKPGVTAAAAEAEVASIARVWAKQFPDTNKELELSVRPLRNWFVDDGTRRLLAIMLGAVLFVLLIACANVANLLLARAAVRQKEICVRVALGASRTQIVRMLLAESFVLAAAGALLGLPLARGLIGLLNYSLQSKANGIPYWIVFDLDVAGLAYIVALTVVTCLAAGLWPAWRASRADLNGVLKDGGRGATGFALSRFTRAMVIGEVALSAVLLVLSGLTIRSVIKMQTTPLGFDTTGVFTCRIAVPEIGYAEAAKQIRFFRDVLDRLAARPEIARAAHADLQPTWSNWMQVEFEGRPRGGPKGSGLPPQHAATTIVSDDYFSTLGITVAQGRVFNERDAPDAPRVAIVSTRFAAKNWPKESALGKRFVFGYGLDVKPDEWMTVVGVVAPTLHGDFDRQNATVEQVYVPYLQHGGRYMTLFVKARTADAALATVVRETVRSVDAELPIFFVRTMDRMLADARFFKNLFAWIFGVFGGVALVLATVGLYGVMSYAVSQRTQEIGVRMALGAQPRDVLTLILREGGLRLAVGLALGLTAAVFAGRLLAFVLFGVEPDDAMTLAATFFLLGGAGLAACLVPALRAVRVNPVEALRCE
jgi:putative ABC transport system permease protein